MSKLIAEAVKSAKRKGIDLSKKKKICMSLDVNGPLTATDSAALEPYPGIKEAIEELHRLGVYIVINSAWDLKTLSIFDQKKLGIISDGIIGESGAVFTCRDSGPVYVSDVDPKDFTLDLFINILKLCSDLGYSIASQGNLVNPCFYHEFEGGLAENQCRDGIFRPSIQEFHGVLRTYGVEGEIVDNCIEIVESKDNYQIVKKILDNDFRLITFRINIYNSKISVEIERSYDKDISLLDLNSLAKVATMNLNGWERFSVNEDYCVDYYISNNVLKKEVNKSVALDMLIDDLCKKEHLNRTEVLVMGIGDKEADTHIKQLDDSIFIGLLNTESENNSDLNVTSSFQFFRIVKEICRLIGTWSQL